MIISCLFIRGGTAILQLNMIIVDLAQFNKSIISLLQT